jgi:dTDP-4-dehydrorhamnose 3,5-epimerase
VVDINPKRKTFGHHREFQLSENVAELLWIPSDYAHGFQALQDNTIVMYKVTNEWNKSSEMSLNPLDPNLGIKWKNIPVLISDKDKNSLTFDSYKSNL